MSFIILQWNDIVYVGNLICLGLLDEGIWNIIETQLSVGGQETLESVSKGHILYVCVCVCHIMQ